MYIAVIGDSGVGKTSLITAAATETFPDHPPPVLPPARLPAETTPEAVPLVITDTSSRPEDRQALEAACQQVNSSLNERHEGPLNNLAGQPWQLGRALLQPSSSGCPGWPNLGPLEFLPPLPRFEPASLAYLSEV